MDPGSRQCWYASAIPAKSFIMSTLPSLPWLSHRLLPARLGSLAHVHVACGAKHQAGNGMELRTKEPTALPPQRSARGFQLSLAKSLALCLITWFWLDARLVSAAEEPGLEIAAAKTEVMKAEKLRIDSMLAGDTEALDRIWHEDFLQISPQGLIRTKANRVQAFRSKSVVYSSIITSRSEVRIRGNMAIVIGSTDRKGREGQRDISGSFRFSRVWLKEDGRWQLVLHQLTPLAKE